MFVGHNAHKIVGLHQTHGHSRLPENSLSHIRSDWRIRGDVCIQFQEGPLPDMYAINPDFISEFVNYIVTHHLAALLTAGPLRCSVQHDGAHHR